MGRAGLQVPEASTDACPANPAGHAARVLCAPGPPSDYHATDDHASKFPQHVRHRGHRFAYKGFSINSMNNFFFLQFVTVVLCIEGGHHYNACTAQSSNSEQLVVAGYMLQNSHDNYVY